ncbi:MAG: helix-turn-helix transcriptional regulator [Clostridia bacterium]|nr:helix-turn-helix transcriptional regulator [Clostridia bacterium]
MIKIKLSDLLGKHKMTQKALSEITNIRPATISKMYYEEVKRIDIKHLNNICKAFDCEISELIEYIPERKKIKNTKKEI